MPDQRRRRRRPRRSREGEDQRAHTLYRSFRVAGGWRPRPGTAEDYQVPQGRWAPVDDLTARLHYLSLDAIRGYYQLPRPAQEIPENAPEPAAVPEQPQVQEPQQIDRPNSPLTSERPRKSFSNFTIVRRYRNIIQRKEEESDEEDWDSSYIVQYGNYAASVVNATGDH